MKNDDREFFKKAIELSHKSMEEGNFPAGAVVVKNKEIIASSVSSPYPSLFHADSKAVTKAFQAKWPFRECHSLYWT